MVPKQMTATEKTENPVQLATPDFWTSSREFLFAPRPLPEPGAPGARNQLSAIDLIVFVLYAAILCFAIRHHLPSDDEGQAWQLARDNSLMQLLFRRMHYEGGAGLWPAILWAANRLGIPHTGMSWISGSFALAGVALLLLYAPLPRIFRWLLPFTFFLQYQYAVIARPYALFPVLLFLLCILYPLRRPRPILFALAAGLMANIGLHAAMLAGFFSLLYLWKLIRNPRMTSRRHLGAAILLFSGFALLSIAVAFPAPDVATDGDPGDTTGSSHPFIRRFIPPERLPAGAPPLDKFLGPKFASLGKEPVETNVVKPTTVGMVIARTLVLGIDTAFYPISESTLLGVVLVSFLYFWLRRRRARFLLLPWLLTIVLAAQILVLDHHTGQYLLSLVAAVWIALTMPEPQPSDSQYSGWLEPAFAALALVLIALQLGWSEHAIRYEWTHPYDPGRATAAYLVAHYPGKRIAGFAYETNTTQLWAPYHLFFNQEHDYWVWSAPVLINRRRTEALLQHPDVVVIGDYIPREQFLFNQFLPLIDTGTHPFHRVLEFWQQRGFHEKARFCGDRLMRLGTANTFCEIVLEANP